MDVCKITQDLLPLYVEGLTSPETNDFVELHLKGCKTCRGICCRMGAELPGMDDGPDFKKGLRSSLAKIIAWVLAAVLLAVGAALYIPWELGYLDRERMESPDGSRYFEVLDNREAGFFRGGAYIKAPDGLDRNLKGDPSYRDFNIWFSPDSQRYFAWIEYEDHNETWINCDSENRDFLGVMAESAAEQMYGFVSPEEFAFSFDRWSDDSGRIYFDFQAADYSGSMSFDCQTREFKLEKAYYHQVRIMPLDTYREFISIVGGNEDITEE